MHRNLFQMLNYASTFVHINYKYNKTKSILKQKMMQLKACPDARYSTLKRKSSAVSKRPVMGNEAVNADDVQEYDAKQYRMLVHCFVNNLNIYYNKRHKNLLGDLEDMYKIPLNKQQKQFLKENLSAILEKNLSKLARDMMARNQAAFKTINQYLQLHQKYINKFQIIGSNHTHQDTDSIYIMTEQSRMKIPPTSSELEGKNQSTFVPKSAQEQRKQQKEEQEIKSMKARPYSGYNRPIHSYNYGHFNKKIIDKKSQTGAIFRNRDNCLSLNGHNFYANNSNNIYFNSISNGSLGLNGQQLLSMQNQEAGEVLIRENFRKTSNRTKYNSINNGKDRKGGEQFLAPIQYLQKQSQFMTIRVGDENNMMEINNVYSQQNIGNVRNLELNKDPCISIGKNKSKQLEYNRSLNISKNRLFYEKYQLMNNCTPYHNQSQGFNINTWNTNRPRSIDEVEKEKWQTKILSMNGVLSANVVKPQGYKPKSKCWGTTVVTSGKIVDKVEKQGSHGGKILFSMLRYKS